MSAEHAPETFLTFQQLLRRLLALGDVVERDDKLTGQKSGVQLANACRTIMAGNPVFPGIDRLAG